MEGSAERKVMETLVSVLKKEESEKEKYKARVKEYTHYLIGRKIPEAIENFTEKEIANGNVSMKSPAILRILTKWCE